MEETHHLPQEDLEWGVQTLQGAGCHQLEEVNHLSEEADSECHHLMVAEFHLLVEVIFPLEEAVTEYHHRLEADMEYHHPLEEDHPEDHLPMEEDTLLLQEVHQEVTDRPWYTIHRSTSHR